MSPANHVFSLCWTYNLTVYTHSFCLAKPLNNCDDSLTRWFILVFISPTDNLETQVPTLLSRCSYSTNLPHRQPWALSPPLFSPSAKSQLPQKLVSVNPNPSPIKWTSKASEGLLSEMLTWQVGAVSCLIPFALLNIVYFDPTAMEMFVFPLGSNRSKTLISWCVSSTSHSHRASKMRNIFKKT